LRLRFGKAAGCGLLASLLFDFVLKGRAEDQVDRLLRVRCGLNAVSFKPQQLQKACRL
jgi:hypothetical protein